jgi:hypothetical protein
MTWIKPQLQLIACFFNYNYVAETLGIGRE